MKMKSCVALGLLACSGLAQAAEVVVFKGDFVSVSKESMKVTNSDKGYTFVLKVDFDKCETTWKDLTPRKGVCKGNTITQSNVAVNDGIAYLSTDVITKSENGVYYWLTSGYTGDHMQVFTYKSESSHKVK